MSGVKDSEMVKCGAYARVYYDGRVNGVEGDDLAAETDEYRFFYDCGYECGVADYCYFELKEEG